MAGEPEPANLPRSLVGITIRRSFTMGRFYLLVGPATSVFIASILSFAGAAPFTAGFPLLVPIWMTMSSLGGLMVFTSDRIKGVFEYALAYGLTPLRLFTDFLLATLTLLALSLTVTLGACLGIFVAVGNTIDRTLVVALLFYTIPMTIGSAAFAATVGMIWTSVSSPRSGMNSPVGLVPMIGIVPSIVTLVVVGVFPAATLLIVSLASAVLGAVVLSLVGSASRLMRLERLLSPT